MTLNKSFSVLPFYDNIEKQNHRKDYAFEKVLPLITPDEEILPFQILRERETIDDLCNAPTLNTAFGYVDSETGILKTTETITGSIDKNLAFDASSITGGFEIPIGHIGYSSYLYQHMNDVIPNPYIGQNITFHIPVVITHYTELRAIPATIIFRKYTTGAIITPTSLNYSDSIDGTTLTRTFTLTYTLVSGDLSDARWYTEFRLLNTDKVSYNVDITFVGATVIYNYTGDVTGSIDRSLAFDATSITGGFEIPIGKFGYGSNIIQFMTSLSNPFIGQVVTFHIPVVITHYTELSTIPTTITLKKHTTGATMAPTSLSYSDSIDGTTLTRTFTLTYTLESGDLTDPRWYIVFKLLNTAGVSYNIDLTFVGATVNYSGTGDATGSIDRNVAYSASSITRGFEIATGRIGYNSIIDQLMSGAIPSPFVGQVLTFYIPVYITYYADLSAIPTTVEFKKHTTGAVITPTTFSYTDQINGTSLVRTFTLTYTLVSGDLSDARWYVEFNLLNTNYVGHTVDVTLFEGAYVNYTHIANLTGSVYRDLSFDASAITGGFEIPIGKFGYGAHLYQQMDGEITSPFIGQVVTFHIPVVITYYADLSAIPTTVTLRNYSSNTAITPTTSSYSDVNNGTTKTRTFELTYTLVSGDLSSPRWYIDFRLLNTNRVSNTVDITISGATIIYPAIADCTGTLEISVDNGATAITDGFEVPIDYTGQGSSIIIPMGSAVPNPFAWQLVTFNIPVIITNELEVNNIPTTLILKKTSSGATVSPSSSTYYDSWDETTLTRTYILTYHLIESDLADPRWYLVFSWANTNVVTATVDVTIIGALISVPYTANGLGDITKNLNYEASIIDYGFELSVGHIGYNSKLYQMMSAAITNAYVGQVITFYIPVNITNYANVNGIPTTLTFRQHTSDTVVTPTSLTYSDSIVGLALIRTFTLTYTLITYDLTNPRWYAEFKMLNTNTVVDVVDVTFASATVTCPAIATITGSIDTSLAYDATSITGGLEIQIGKIGYGSNVYQYMSGAIPNPYIGQIITFHIPVVITRYAELSTIPTTIALKKHTTGATVTPTSLDYSDSIDGTTLTRTFTLTYTLVSGDLSDARWYTEFRILNMNKVSYNIDITISGATITFPITGDVTNSIGVNVAYSASSITGGFEIATGKIGYSSYLYQHMSGVIPNPYIGQNITFHIPLVVTHYADLNAIPTAITFRKYTTGATVTPTSLDYSDSIDGTTLTRTFTLIYALVSGDLSDARWYTEFRLLNITNTAHIVDITISGATIAFPTTETITGSIDKNLAFDASSITGGFEIPIGHIGYSSYLYQHMSGVIPNPYIGQNITFHIPLVVTHYADLNAIPTAITFRKYTTGATVTPTSLNYSDSIDGTTLTRTFTLTYTLVSGDLSDARWYTEFRFLNADKVSYNVDITFVGATVIYTFNTKYVYSNFIAISVGTSYYFKGVEHVAWYSSNNEGAFISGNGTTGIISDRALVSPGTANYMRFDRYLGLGDIPNNLTVVDMYVILGNHLVNPTTIDYVKLRNFDGTLVADIKTQMLENGLTVYQYPVEGFDIIVYPGQHLLTTNTPEGRYYIELFDTVTIWYSEVFNITKSTDQCLKIVYKDYENLIFDKGIIVFENNFAFNLYLPTQIGRPDYEFEEQLEKRDGYQFIKKQISEKTYRFNFIAPEYLLDAMLIIRMMDNVEIISSNNTYVINQFLITPKWQDGGYLASVEAEFQCATVIKKIGDIKI